MRELRKGELERLRKEYPVGCRIVLDAMDDPQAPPAGTQGTVRFIDDAGDVHTVWDNGSGLACIPSVDGFHKIRTEEEAGTTLLKAAKAQHDGARCPRCGKEMPGKLYAQALSRRLDIMVCDACGQAEALEDAGIIKGKKKLMEWTAVREPQEGGGPWQG